MAQACLQSYCVLRLVFVRHCCEQMQQGMARGDWRTIEAALYALAAIGAWHRRRRRRRRACLPVPSCLEELQRGGGLG